MVRVLSFLFLFTFSFSAWAAVGSGGVPQIGYGKDFKGTTAPSISASDPTLHYTAVCGNATSNVTAGNYYRCYKQGGSGTSDWTVAADKTAYCSGYEALTNTGASAVSVTFGYGTTQVTHNNSAAPTGNVSYAANGASDVFSSNGADNQPVWRGRPIKFSGTAAAAIIYPYILSGSSSYTMTISFICQDL